MHSNTVQQSQKSSNLLTGILLIFIGASSYGMLSTFVKLSYKEGYTTAEVTGSQFVWGVVVLSILAFFVPKTAPKATSHDKFKLMLAGTTVGFTSVLYYICVNYITASVAVVLLMQSVWLGVLFESLIKKTWPTIDKIIAVFLVLFGTVLATNVLDTSSTQLDIRGIIFGLLAAVSFSGTMAATGNVAFHLPSVKRSQYMVYGGLVVVILFTLLTQVLPYSFDIKLIGEGFIHSKAYDFKIFFTYGLLLSTFGTILPPLVLNKGFPITGVALGSIISSVELPFAMMIASVLLGEHINGVQVTGVAIIIISVLLLNYRMVLKENKNNI